MATFKARPDFINNNIGLMSNRQSSMYAKYLESKPTFVTYYHINKIHSRTDPGLKIPEKLSGVLSPIRYNKILNFPIYGIEQIQLSIDEDEEGLNSDYSGEAIILPNTIHPTVDDYFFINYLDKPYAMRVIKYEYDTIKSNNYYKIEFTLHSLDADFLNDLETQVIKTYRTIFENIGTEDKVFITDEEAELQGEINELYDALAQEYLDNYFEPTREPYNTLLFVEPSKHWFCDYDYIFDQNLVYFCNQTHLFCDEHETNAILFYEEPKKYFNIEYKDSIFFMVQNNEFDRINKIAKFYTLEPATALDSIFMYYREKRAKYLKLYKTEKNVFGGTNEAYIPNEIITSVESKQVIDTNPIDSFISYWMIDSNDTDNLLALMKKINKNHNEFSFHNFIFIPIVLYCLRDLANKLMSFGPDGLEDELGNEIGVENI